VIPGGSSSKVLKAGEKYKIKERQPDGTTAEREIGLEEIVMDFDSLAAAGSMAGSGGVIVMDDTRDMVEVLNNINEFYAHESCGQCTPCRVGCQQLLMGIKAVKRGEKNARYLDKLLILSETMKLTAKCGLGQSVANSFSSIVENFREEMIY